MDISSAASLVGGSSAFLQLVHFHRNRALLLVVYLAIAATVSKVAYEIENSREEIPKSQEWWLSTVPAYSDSKFRRTFRVPRKLFNDIVLKACSAREFNVSASNRSRALEVDIQIGCAIWRLGRSVSVPDVANQFGISDGSVINACERTYQFIAREYASEIFKHQREGVGPWDGASPSQHPPPHPLP